MKSPAHKRGFLWPQATLKHSKLAMKYTFVYIQKASGLHIKVKNLVV